MRYQLSKHTRINIICLGFIFVGVIHPLTEGWEINERLEDQIELVLDAGVVS